MTEDQQPIADDDLIAYVDGRLPEERRALVERMLAENPGIHARIVADRAANESLRQRLNPIADQPIPRRLRVEAIQSHRRETLRRRLKTVAACALLLFGGVAAGWEAHDIAPSSQQAALSMTTTDAIAAHRVFVVETAHPVEVGAKQQAHLVQWLSRRVGRPLIVPDLSAQGYTLMGGRVLPGANEAAAQFMFENGTGLRLTVYVRASAGDDTRFRFASSQGVAAFSWIDQGLGFAIVGTVGRPRLLEAADAVYRQVDPQHRNAPADL